MLGKEQKNKHKNLSSLSGIEPLPSTWPKVKLDLRINISSKHSYYYEILRIGDISTSVSPVIDV